MAMDERLPASATQACAWIVEQVEHGGSHMFKLKLSVDAPSALAVRFQGSNFTSASMGGDMIQLDAGQAKEVDSEGFDVSAGDDLRFEVKLFDRPIASLDEMNDPTRKPLVAFAFHGKVGNDERAPPAALAAKQCKPLG